VYVCAKAAIKTLMKLTPGFNLINVLRATFINVNLNSIKRYWQLNCIFLRFQGMCVQKLLLKPWWNWHLGSISSMFYIQLLRSRSPKAQNDNADLTVFFACSGSTCVKAVRRTLMKLTPGADAIKKFTPSLGIPD